MNLYIDHSLYPDYPEPPDTLPTAEDRADYLHRVCSAWDFCIFPEEATFRSLAEWKEIFDRFPIPTSPAYHAFRAIFRWEPVPVPVDLPPPTPRYVHLDRLEGRPPDPCEGMI